MRGQRARINKLLTDRRKFEGPGEDSQHRTPFERRHTGTSLIQITCSSRLTLRYRLSTAFSTSRTPIAPTKRDVSSKSATGAVCDWCMACITDLREVPGLAQ